MRARACGRRSDPRISARLESLDNSVAWNGFTGTACTICRAWPATTRHREAEGSSYYRHFYMGLLRENGSPKPAAVRFATLTPALGICQWFHFEDHRLDDAVRWLCRLGVRHLRTGLSWSDSYRPGWEAWFDRQML